MCRAGVKTNVIPDTVDIEVDIRTVPGDNEDEVRRHLGKALGDLVEEIEIEKLFSKQASASPIGTPLWDVLARVSGRLVKDSALVPSLMAGGTDNRFFRRAGSVGYGFALFSRRIDFESHAAMWHGSDERVDQESLALSEQLWEAVARELLT